MEGVPSFTGFLQQLASNSQHTIESKSKAIIVIVGSIIWRIELKLFCFFLQQVVETQQADWLSTSNREKI